MPWTHLLTFIALVTSSSVYGATTLKLNKHASGLALSLVQTKLLSSASSTKRQSQLSLDHSTSGGVTYTIDVVVGGTEIPVIIDTGSTEFWVPSSSCTSCQEDGMTLSTLIADDGCTSQSITYGIGSVEGCISNATLQVSDYTVKGLHLLAATDVGSSMDWEGKFMSGIWGMGRDSGTLDGAPTAVSLMYKQGLIQTPTVGFYLARESDDADSELTIGDVTTVSYADTSKKVTLKSQDNSMGLYVVTLDKMTVNGETLGQNTPAVIDTGSTGISAPASLISGIYSALFGGSTYMYDNHYIVPCQPLSNATISFTFGGTEFSMEPADIIGDVIENGFDWCYGRFIILSGELQICCIRSAADWQPGVNELVIGDAFLHNVYHSVNVETGDVTFYGLT